MQQAILNSQQEIGALPMMKENYDVAIEITYNTEVLKSNLCDYNNAYILVRSNFTIIGHPATQIAFNR